MVGFGQHRVVRGAVGTYCTCTVHEIVSNRDRYIAQSIFGSVVNINVTTNLTDGSTFQEMARPSDHTYYTVDYSDESDKKEVD